MIFDIDQERLDELTAAFRAGEHRGRQQAEESRIERHDVVECIILNLFAVSSVVGVWAFIAWAIFG